LILNPASDVANNMPQMIAAARSWPVGRFATYMKNAELGAIGNIETADFNLTDLLVTVQIMGYVETVLDRFDTDHSGSINLKEATVAYPLFGPTLTHLLFGLPPDADFPLFTFMLKYGDTPLDMFGGSVLFNYWMWHRDGEANPPLVWKFEADRNAIMGLLSQLSKF
jgi:hypothetical protein